MSSQSPTRCVSCEKVLTLFIEPDEEDDDAPMEGSGDAAEGSYVDDDVHLQCGCHFHWFVYLSVSLRAFLTDSVSLGNVYWTRTPRLNVPIAAEISRARR